MKVNEEKSKPAILRWWERIAMVLGGIVVLIIVLAIVGSIIGSESNEEETTTDTNNTARMAAHVHVQAGAVNVINNNDFPWYGLITTVNDDYSTRYRFGDFNYPWIRSDSILEPGERYGPSITAFIDKHGNEFEGVIYTITVKKVELEAKSQPDGPYDLSFKISTTDANAIPTPVRRPTIQANLSGSGLGTGLDFDWTSVEHHEPEYDEVLAFVSDYRQDGFGSYILPAGAYKELQSILGRALSREDANKAERWQEQWHHWENVNAFKTSMGSIAVDRIIDNEESKHICFALDQWITQMADAQDYVKDYRRDAPELTLKSGLGNLEKEAERALEILSEVECE